MSNLRSAARQIALPRIFSLVLFAIFCSGAIVTPADAQTFTTLHTFTSSLDGASPFGGLVADRNGNYYGTTQHGGSSGNGTVFEMSPPAAGSADWTESIIWNFAGGADGSVPSFQLVIDGKGNLYGETQDGGGSCSCGSVFVLVPPKTSGANWSKRILYLPAGVTAGFYGGLTLDSTGDVYGIQSAGGTFAEGLAFKVTPVSGGGYRSTVLYNFGATKADSMRPYGPLTIDSSGNLYGASYDGGKYQDGTVYKLTPPTGGSGAWSNTVLFSFNTGTGGNFPDGNVILDKTGRIYGQTTGGGTSYGTIFRLTPTESGEWMESVLHTFDDTDGGVIYSSLALDSRTNTFYGTSFSGGLGNGVVFELTPPANGSATWTDTVLHTFTGQSDGGSPLGPMVWDANGVLYGTTYYGDAGYGEVFSITP